MIKKLFQYFVFIILFLGILVGIPYLIELLCNLDFLKNISTEIGCNIWILISVANIVNLYRLHKK